MRKSTLKSTTSLVVSFSLIASPIFAQEVTIEGDAPVLCMGLEPLDANNLTAGIEAATELALPCLDADGTIIADQEALDAALQMQAEAAETAEDAPITDEVSASEDAVVAAETPEAEVIVEDGPVEETTEEAVAEEAPVEETVEEPVAEEAPAETSEADVVVTDGLAEDGEGDTVVAEEMPEGGEGDVIVTEELPEGGDSDATVAEGLPEDEDTEVVVTEGAPAGGETEVTEEMADAATGEEQIIVDDTPPAAAAAAEVEGDTEGESAAEVVVEDLTEDDVRSSDEDFETTATGDAAVTASDDGDSGLSNFERALLIGLGAVVVGSVLDNGDEVLSNSGDRVVVRRNDELVVLKDDDVLLRQPGSQVETQSFSDGSTRTVVTRADGNQTVTIRAGDGRVLRRTRIFEDGSEFVLFDDTVQAAPVEVTELPTEEEAAVQMQVSRSDVDSIRLALLANQNTRLDRTYSLRQVREIEQVRALAPEVELDTVTFASGSAAIQPSQAEELTDLGIAISNIIDDDPGQVFLIEGHTDAVGDAGYNLALSDRRAETVALAMTEYFGVPPENLITQGYGESLLKVQTLGDERANRRASVRNITSLLR